MTTRSTGRKCRVPGQQPGEIKTEFTADQPNSSRITYHCQYGPPVLTIGFVTVAVLRLAPIGAPAPTPPPDATAGHVTANPPGTSCESQDGPCTIEYHDEKAEVTLRAQPTNSISDFDGWGGACESAGTDPVCVVTMDRSRTVTASFGAVGF